MSDWRAKAKAYLEDHAGAVEFTVEGYLCEALAALERVEKAAIDADDHKTKGNTAWLVEQWKEMAARSRAAGLPKFESQHLALLSAATCDACLRLVLAHLHERVGAAVINAIATTNRHDPDHVLYANVKDALRREFGEKTKEVGHE